MLAQAFAGVSFRMQKCKKSVEIILSPQSQPQHCRVFRADFVAGAAHVSISCRFRTQYFQACAPMSWQAQHFGWVDSLSQWRGALFENAKGMHSEPSAHFGWVESLSLWRGAHFETRDVSSDLSQKCRSAVSTSHSEVPIRSVALKCCSEVLRSVVRKYRSERSVAQSFRSEVLCRSFAQKYQSEVSITEELLRNIAEKCRSEVLRRSVLQKYR